MYKYIYIYNYKALAPRPHSCPWVRVAVCVTCCHCLSGPDFARGWTRTSRTSLHRLFEFGVSSFGPKTPSFSSGIFEFFPLAGLGGLFGIFFIGPFAGPLQVSQSPVVFLVSASVPNTWDFALFVWASTALYNFLYWHFVPSQFCIQLASAGGHYT